MAKVDNSDVEEEQPLLDNKNYAYVVTTQELILTKPPELVSKRTALVNELQGKGSEGAGRVVDYRAIMDEAQLLESKNWEDMYLLVGKRSLIAQASSYSSHMWKIVPRTSTPLR